MKTCQNYPTMKDFTKKVVITINQNHVTARIYDDNTIVAKGVATCSHEDKFDFRTGAELALKRAFESIETKEPTNNTEWVKVDRKPVPGDYIRVTYKGYPFGDFGDILKVHHTASGYVNILLEDHPKAKEYIKKNAGGRWLFNTWTYTPGEYEVVERASKKKEESVTPPTEKFRRITRMPKDGDYVRITNKCYSFDDPNAYLKVNKVYTTSSGFFRGIDVLTKDYPELTKEKIKKTEKVSDEYIWSYTPHLSKMEFYEKVEDNVETWNGMRFRKVDREVRAGDYIRLRKPFFTFDNTDYFMKVSRVSHKNGKLVPHVNHIDNPGASKECKDQKPNYEWNYWEFCGDVYEKVDE